MLGIWNYNLDEKFFVVGRKAKKRMLEVKDKKVAITKLFEYVSFTFDDELWIFYNFGTAIVNDAMHNSSTMKLYTCNTLLSSLRIKSYDLFTVLSTNKSVPNFLTILSPFPFACSILNFKFNFKLKAVLEKSKNFVSHFMKPLRKQTKHALICLLIRQGLVGYFHVDKVTSGRTLFLSAQNLLAPRFDLKHCSPKSEADKLAVENLSRSKIIRATSTRSSSRSVTKSWNGAI